LIDFPYKVCWDQTLTYKVLHRNRILSENGGRERDPKKRKIDKFWFFEKKKNQTFWELFGFLSNLPNFCPGSSSALLVHLCILGAISRFQTHAQIHTQLDLEKTFRLGTGKKQVTLGYKCCSLPNPL
jgi:hypothetical protein